MHPLKEIDFFARDESGVLPPWFATGKDALVPRTLDDYARLFEGGAGCLMRGEFSVSYLDVQVAPRIAKTLPDAKLICILRHPVDQARSWAEVMLGHPPTESELAMLLSIDEGVHGFPLRAHGQYHEHLAPYFRLFSPRQICVRTFGELTTDPVFTLFELQDFLGVRPVRLDLPHWNRSGANLGVPGGAKAWAKRILPDGAVRSLAGLLHRLRERKAPETAKVLPPWFKDEMLDCWYPDVVPGLERLGVDVSEWKR